MWLASNQQWQPREGHAVGIWRQPGQGMAAAACPAVSQNPKVLADTQAYPLSSSRYGHILWRWCQLMFI